MSFHTIDDGRGILPQLCVEVDVTNVPTGSTRTWTDITTDIRAVTWQRAGRQDELQRTQPGSMTLVLSNASGDYDPTNSGGIGLKRAQWIRVRAQWADVVYPIWQGVIETVRQNWPEAGKDATATIVASDILRIVNAFDLYDETFDADTSDQRVAAVCDLISGVPYQLDDTGATTLVAVTTPFSVGSGASSHLQQVEETENGLIFVTPDGQVEFQSRHYRLLNAGASVDTIGDGDGEIPYAGNPEFDEDDPYIYNVAEVTTTNADGSSGDTETAENTDSQDLYWPRAIQRTVLSSDDNEASDCAAFLVGKYGDPSPRLPAVTVKGVKDTSKWPTILGMVNSQRFTFTRRATATISQDMFVEQVSGVIAPNQAWDVTVQLSPADSAIGWVLDDDTYSVLGTTTIPIY